MYQLAWPWALGLVAFPLAVAWLLPPARTSADAALRVPFYAQLEAQSASNTVRTRNKSLLLSALMVWVCLIVAASRPQHVGAPIGLNVSGRDLILAVDTSVSMQTTDMALLIDGRSRAVNRLQAVQHLGGRFIERRVGDRVGLILFGSHAYLQSPLTFDLRLVRELLDEASIGLAGETTAIGDAIALGIKRLHKRPSQSKVLVLMTDGANTAGRVTPEHAARLANVAGLKVYTIGIGAATIRPDSASKRGVSRGANHLISALALDETLLQQIAAVTGGMYLRAEGAEGLSEVYAKLDEVEPIANSEERLRPIEELYPWPLAAALLGTLLMLVVLGHRPAIAVPDAAVPPHGPAADPS